MQLRDSMTLAVKEVRKQFNDYSSSDLLLVKILLDDELKKRHLPYG
jgi:hypothetical protein